MKTIATVMLLLVLTGSTFAQKNQKENSQILGTWKFSNKSMINDFQQVFKSKDVVLNEYFTFDANHSFRHEFYDSKDNLIKTLKGKWKSTGEKINIAYSDIDYTLLTTYFFIDKDLVLGKNFSHVIFTKATDDYNVAMK